MASRIETLRAAEQLARRGQYLEAAESLIPLVKTAPRDVALINKMGDFYVRADHIDEAVEQYEKIAGYYQEDGFLLKAIAILKKVVKLEPSRCRYLLRLGELYAEHGLGMEARQNFVTAADVYFNRGKAELAVEALRRVETLYPEDYSIRKRLLDLLVKAGHSDDVAAQYVSIAEQQMNAGLRDESLEMIEQSLGMGLPVPALAERLARLYLIAGKPEKAESILEKGLPAEDEGSEFRAKTLLLLGEAKLASGNIQEAKDLYQQALKLDFGNDQCHMAMGRWFLASGDVDRAFEQCLHVFQRSESEKNIELCDTFLSEILEKDPVHIPALRERALLSRDRGDLEGIVRAHGELAEGCREKGQFKEAVAILDHLLKMAGPPDSVKNHYQEMVSACRNRLDEQPGAPDESIMELVIPRTEDDVDLDEDQADSQPEVKAIEDDGFDDINGSDRVRLGDEATAPDHEAHIELVIDDGSDTAEPSDAAAEPLISVTDDDSVMGAEPVMPAPDAEEDAEPPQPQKTGDENIEIIIDESDDEPVIEISLDDDDADAEELLETVAVEDGAPAEAPEPEGKEAKDDSRPGSDEVFIKRRLNECRVFVSYGLLDKALGQVNELLERFPQHRDGILVAEKIYRELGRDEDADAMRARLEDLFEVSDSPAGMEQETAAPIRPTAAWMKPAKAPAGETDSPDGEEEKAGVEEPEVPTGEMEDAEQAAEPPDPIREQLEEVDFLLENGFIRDAADVLEGLAQANPNHSGIQQRLSLVAAAVEEASQAVGTTEVSAAGSGTTFEDETVAEIFSMFQQDVAGQVDEEDFETHYNLGIAYKEMELVDEAIGEFQVACKSPTRRVHCCSMLGACFLEKGMTGQAVTWLERGVETAESGSDEKKGLCYDLGHILETSGETARALEVFETLLAMDDGFRDVKDRIGRLSPS